MDKDARRLDQYRHGLDAVINRLAQRNHAPTRKDSSVATDSVACLLSSLCAVLEDAHDCR